MNIKNTTNTFVIVLAMTFALAIVPTLAFGQNNDDKQLIASSQEKRGNDNDLVGVWEAVDVPSEFDCVTGLPVGPLVNVMYTFNQGGTMYAEDTLPIDRYRTTGSGIWKRVTGRNYTYRFFHYGFAPDGSFLFTLKGSSNLKLSRDGNSLIEQGRFEVIEPSGNVVYAGCFNGSSHRVTF